MNKYDCVTISQHIFGDEIFLTLLIVKKILFTPSYLVYLTLLYLILLPYLYPISPFSSFLFSLHLHLHLVS